MSTPAELKNIEVNLNRELQKIKGGTMKGLIMAAALIRNETENTPPLTPVDLGNLRSSWFVTTAKGVHAGKGTGQFKGPKASLLSSEHINVITEAQGMAVAQSVGKKQILIMGYSANYAMYVHEGPGGNLGAKFQRPGAGPKWLEAAFKRNSGKIVQIVKDNAKVKG